MLFLHLYENNCQVNSKYLEKLCLIISNTLPKEISWKALLEIAEISQKIKMASIYKYAIKESLLISPTNLIWKPLISICRLQTKNNISDNSINILKKILNHSNEKQRIYVLIEISKHYEYLGKLYINKKKLISIKKYNLKIINIILINIL